MIVLMYIVGGILMMVAIGAALGGEWIAAVISFVLMLIVFAAPSARKRKD